MKNLIIFTLFGLFLTGVLTGCGDTSTTTSTAYDVGGDLYVQNGDGTITIVKPDGSTQTTEVPYDPDNYDPSYDKKTCTALGFFWCPIEQKCLNIPLDKGKCPQNDSNSTK